MSLYRHHAVVLTSNEDPPIQLSALRSIAVNLCLDPTELKQGSRNHQWSFAVLPDGSSETFSFSQDMDDARAELMKYASFHGVQYVEVYFGGDEGIVGITNHDAIRREDRCRQCGREAAPNQMGLCYDCRSRGRT